MTEDENEGEEGNGSLAKERGWGRSGGGSTIRQITIKEV